MNMRNIILSFFIIFMGFGMLAKPACAQKSYENKRFKYSIQYPAMFGTVHASKDGKGMSTSSADGKYTLAITTAKNDGKKGEELLKQAIAKTKHFRDDSDQSNDDFFVFIYGDGENKFDFLQYTIVNDKQTATFIFRYPKTFGDEVEFNDVVKEMGRNFTFTN